MSGYLKATIWMFIAFCASLVFLYLSATGKAEFHRFSDDFSKVGLGSSQIEALQVLGEADATELVFRLGQEEGFEASYIRAAASDAKHYLLWSRGADVVFSIGIDKHGLVVLKESDGP